MRNDAPSTPVSAGSCPGAGRLDAQVSTPFPSISHGFDGYLIWFMKFRRHPQQSMRPLFPGIKIPPPHFTVPVSVTKDLLLFVEERLKGGSHRLQGIVHLAAVMVTNGDHRG